MAWETRPGLGRYGAILFAAQTAVGVPASAPTHTLLATTFMPPLEQLIKTKDAGANGSIRNRRSRVQGVMSDGRQIGCELTMSALAELCKAIGPVASGVVTPSALNFGDLAPGVPYTVWQLHHTGDRIAQDVQIGANNIAVGGRVNVTAQITLNVTSSKPLAGPAPEPVLPSDMLQFKHWWLKLNDTVFKPEQGGINLAIPMGVVDGANGTDAVAANYPAGWERTDSPTLTVNFALPKLHDFLRDAYEQNGLIKLETGFTIPGTPAQTGPPAVAAVPARTLSFKILTAEVSEANPGSGTDRITVPYVAVGVSPDTLAEFTVNLPS